MFRRVWLEHDSECVFSANASSFTAHCTFWSQLHRRMLSSVPLQPLFGCNLIALLFGYLDQLGSLLLSGNSIYSAPSAQQGSARQSEGYFTLTLTRPLFLVTYEKGLLALCAFSLLCAVISEATTTLLVSVVRSYKFGHEEPLTNIRLKKAVFHCGHYSLGSPQP